MEKKTKDYKVEKRRIGGKALVEYKKGLKLTQQQKNILVGTLLGDACISMEKEAAYCRVRFWQKGTQVDYVHHLYDVFKPYVGTSPQIRAINNSYHKTPGKACSFNTYSHPDFAFYSDLFYTGERKGFGTKKLTTGIKPNTRKKRVPPNIAELLTAEGLAYWFMDDGSAIVDKRRKTSNRSFYFSTHGFCYEDQVLLQLTLKKNFGICATIRKNRQFFILGIRVKSNEKFISLIIPFLRSSFYYKLGI